MHCLQRALHDYILHCQRPTRVSRCLRHHGWIAAWLAAWLLPASLPAGAPQVAHRTPFLHSMLLAAERTMSARALLHCQQYRSPASSLSGLRFAGVQLLCRHEKVGRGGLCRWSAVQPLCRLISALGPSPCASCQCGIVRTAAAPVCLAGCCVSSSILHSAPDARPSDSSA